MERFISTFGGCFEIKEKTSILDALVVAKLADSKGEARRFIQGKQVKLHCIHSTAVTMDKQLTIEDCQEDRFLFILCGKNAKLIKLVPE